MNVLARIFTKLVGARTTFYNSVWYYQSICIDLFGLNKVCVVEMFAHVY